MTTPDSPSRLATDWRDLIVDDDATIRRIVADTRRVAVLGIKMEAFQPAYYVPEYAQKAGMEIVPVPVYYPDCTEILGEKIYRRVADIPGEIDMVNVFRRPKDVPPHVDDIIAKRPKVVWMQMGIRNDDVAEQLVAAGIDVVQDRCLMVDHRHYGR